MLVSLKRRVEFIHPKGRKVYRSVITFSRGGTMSPVTEYIVTPRVKRLISPFERRVRGWKTTFSSLLAMYLDYDLLTEEMLHRDWLLKSIPSDSMWTGGTIKLVTKRG